MQLAIDCNPTSITTLWLNQFSLYTNLYVWLADGTDIRIRMMTQVILSIFHITSDEKLGGGLGTGLISGVVVQPGSNLRWLVLPY